MSLPIITATGHYVPPHVVDNTAFANVPDDNYILRKTGIQERRYLKEGATSDMAVAAIQQCLNQRGLTIDAIDCLIVATVTPDYQFPSTAAVVLHKLKATQCWGFDIGAACSGFLYGLHLASQMLVTGSAKRILVCGAETISSTLNFDDVKSSILFGDGAGVVLVEVGESSGAIVFDTICKMRPEGLKEVYMDDITSKDSLNIESFPVQNGKMVMHGRLVYQHGIEAMTEAATYILTKNSLSISDVQWLIPHQCNLRMMEAVADNLKLPPQKMLVNIDRYGNTAGASVPICLSEYAATGCFQDGDLILVTTAGSGYAYGAGLLKWRL